VQESLATSHEVWNILQSYSDHDEPCDRVSEEIGTFGDVGYGGSCVVGRNDLKHRLI